MMRRPKHRHHPDIWRERRRQDRAWLKRRDRLWPAFTPYTAEVAATATLPIGVMQALFDRIEDSCLTLDDYYGNPAGVLAYSGISASAGPSWITDRSPLLDRFEATAKDWRP